MSFCRKFQSFYTLHYTSGLFSNFKLASEPIVFFQVSKCNMKTVQKFKFSFKQFLLSSLPIAIYRLTNLNCKHSSLRINFSVTWLHVANNGSITRLIYCSNIMINRASVPLLCVELTPGVNSA